MIGGFFGYVFRVYYSVSFDVFFKFLKIREVLIRWF